MAPDPLVLGTAVQLKSDRHTRAACSPQLEPGIRDDRYVPRGCTRWRQRAWWRLEAQDIVLEFVWGEYLRTAHEVIQAQAVCGDHDIDGGEPVLHEGSCVDGPPARAVWPDTSPLLEPASKFSFVGLRFPLEVIMVSVVRARRITMTGVGRGY